MATYAPSAPLIGANLNISLPTASLPTNSAGTAIPPFALGTRCLGNADTEWVFVKASGAISAYDCVTIDSSFTASRATVANAATGLQVGFAQNAFADTDYGWVALRGNGISVNVSGTASVGVNLYLSTTSGKLCTTTSSGTIFGVTTLTANAASSVAASVAIVNWPRFPVASTFG